MINNEHDENLYISPNWQVYHKVWLLTAISLTLLLFILTILGYAPSKHSKVKPVGTTNKATPVLIPTPDSQPITTTTQAKDTVKPIIKLHNVPIMYLTVGKRFIDSGAYATDNIDEDIIVTRRGSVNTKVPGEYIIIYTATDSAGNSASISRKVIVFSTNAKLEEKLKQDQIIEPPKVTLYFDHDKSDIPTDPDATIINLLKYLTEHQGAKASITGFYDPNGDNTYNQQLLKKRTQSVKQLMQEKGISTDRININVNSPLNKLGISNSQETRRVDISIQD